MKTKMGTTLPSKKAPQPINSSYGRPWILFLFLLVLPVFALLACGDDENTDRGIPAKASDLDGRTFDVKEMVSRKLVPNSVIRLSVDGSRFVVEATCFEMSGSYDIQSGRFRVNDHASRGVACEGPFAEQDEWLKKGLVAGFETNVDGRDLILSRDDVSIILDDRHEPLVGPTWERSDGPAHTRLYESSGVDPPSLRFAKDGGLVISIPCNKAGGNYEVTPVGDGVSRLKLSYFQTEMACPGRRGQLERTFMHSLGTRPLYMGFEGNNLVLADNRGLENGLTFLPSEDVPLG